MPLRNLLAVLALATGCATGAEPAPAAPTPTPTAAPAAPLLAIHEMTFFDGDKPRMHLAANGNLEVRMSHYKNNGAVKLEDNKLVGTFAADGTITSAAKDKVARLAADGTLSAPDGKVAPFKLVDDTLVIDDKKFTLDATGVLLKDGAAVDPSMRVEGATDAASRRTALLALGLMLASPAPTVTTQSVDEVH